MADEPDLQPGDTGADVTYLKQLVNYWDAAQLDETNDQYDNELGEALRRFQTSRGLPDISYCDRATWDALLGRNESQGGDGESGEGAALAEPVWMEIDDQIYMSDHAVRWWAGNPAQPARTDAQTIKLIVLRPDGSETYGGQRAFPEMAGTVGPGEYAIIDHDATGAAMLLPGQGYTVRVFVNPDTAVESSRDFKFDIDENFHWNWPAA
jgi:peptidoglycan hydrolase-like protein with peptidoglycan-binding domain